MRVLTIKVGLLFCLVMSLTSLVKANDMNPIITFDNEQELKNWVIVNDTVMGGRSSASLRSNDNYLVFSGKLSLENNGGFASTRRINAPLHYKANRTIEISVLGDGRDYQFRLRTNANFDGVAYVAKFSTIAGKQQRFTFNEADFTPQFRGREVPNAPKLSFADLTQLGFMLADKTPGEFVLKVLHIR